jgi:hypothetical protein
MHWVEGAGVHRVTGIESNRHEILSKHKSRMVAMLEAAIGAFWGSRRDATITAGGSAPVLQRQALATSRKRSISS